MGASDSSRPHGARESPQNGWSQPGNAMAWLGDCVGGRTWGASGSSGSRANQVSHPLVALV